MKVFIQVKNAGRRRPVLENKPYLVPKGIDTLRQLIQYIVESEVKIYNCKQNGAEILRTLTQQEIDDGYGVGKIGFGHRFADSRADSKEAVHTAVLGFADGLYKVVRNDEECTDLDEQLSLQEGDNFTFIRLTFLRGKLW